MAMRPVRTLPTRIRASALRRPFGSALVLFVVILVLVVGRMEQIRRDTAAAQQQAIDRAERAIDRAEEAISRVEEANRRLIEQRSESRLINCNVLKSFAVGHNALVESHNTFVDFLATDGGRREVDPDALPLIEVEKERNNKNVVPVPDCSPEGLSTLPGEDDVTAGETTEPVPADIEETP